MKLFRQYFFVLIAAIFASACVAPKAVIEGDSAQARAGNAIAQAEVALTKSYRLVTDQAAAGVLFKSELQEALTVLDKAAKLVDEAKALYSKNVFDGALQKVLDADQALNYVEAEIAKKLKERRQPVSLVQPMDEDDAKLVCADMVIQFVMSYQTARKEKASEQDILNRIHAPSKALTDASKRFVSADFKGDRAAAQAALNDVYKLCVARYMHPEVQA